MEPYELVGDWVCLNVALKVDVVPCAHWVLHNTVYNTRIIIFVIYFTSIIISNPPPGSDTERETNTLLFAAS